MESRGKEIWFSECFFKKRAGECEENGEKEMVKVRR